MINIEEKFKDLSKSAKMESREDIQIFETTVYELASTKNLIVFNRLMDYFDDNCEFPEVMFSLVHALETYPVDVYTKGVINKIQNFKDYPEWFLCLMYSILNTKACLVSFEKNMYLAPKELLFELFSLIYQESKEHRSIIDNLRKIWKLRNSENR